MQKFKWIVGLIGLFGVLFYLKNMNKWHRADMIAEAHAKVIVAEIEAAHNPRTHRAVVSIHDRSANLLQVLHVENGEKLHWIPTNSPGVFFRLVLNDGDLPYVTVPPGPTTNEIGYERGVSSVKIEVDPDHHPNGNVIGRLVFWKGY